MTRTLEDAFFAGEKRKALAASDTSLLKKAEAIRRRLFEQQNAFIDDPHDRKVLRTPRRAGKTEAEVADKALKGLRIRDGNLVYCCPTREWAERNIWKTLHEYDERFELGLDFNKSALTAQFPQTNAVIRLAGCQTEHDADKFRGQKYDDFTFDECASFRSKLLKYAIEECVEPALGDKSGILKMMGSPGHVLRGPFYDASGPEASSEIEREEAAEKRALSRSWRDRAEPRWAAKPWTYSSHFWTVADNIRQPQIWQAALRKKANKGWLDDNPIWMREYMGIWIADLGGLVYKYLASRNAWRVPMLHLPGGARSAIHQLSKAHAWRFVIGLDLGFDDPFALQVAAYSDDCKQFFQCYEFSSSGLIIPQMAEQIRLAIETIERNGGTVEQIVGDRGGGGGKQVIETLNAMHGFGIEPAKKQEKADNRDVLNSDLQGGHCLIMAGSELEGEMEIFAFDEDGNEPDTIPNDNCDAFLYLATAAQHHFSEERGPVPEITTAQKHDEQEQEEIARLAEAERRASQADGYGYDVELDRPYAWEPDKTW